MTGRDWRHIQGLLAELIDLLAAGHPAGIRVLLGEATPPSSVDLAELLDDGAPGLGTRVDGGTSTPYAEICLMKAEPYLQAVESAGGWDHLSARCREYAEACPREWGIFLEHVKWVKPGGTSHIGGSRVDRIADRFGVSGITVRRKRAEVPEEIARLVVVYPPESEPLRLVSGG